MTRDRYHVTTAEVRRVTPPDRTCQQTTSVQLIHGRFEGATGKGGGLNPEMLTLVVRNKLFFSNSCYHETMSFV